MHGEQPRHLERLQRKLEHAGQPRGQGLLIVHHAMLDGGLQSVRMAVTAYRQRLARELQQSGQYRGVHRTGNS